MLSKTWLWTTACPSTSSRATLVDVLAFSDTANVKLYFYTRSFLSQKLEDSPKPDQKYDYTSLIRAKKVRKGDMRRITAVRWETVGITTAWKPSLRPNGPRRKAALDAVRRKCR